jgi:hypothetical protein
MKQRQRTAVFAVVLIVVVALIGFAKYSPCRWSADGSYWWSIQHVAGNQCWKWQG